DQAAQFLRLIQTVAPLTLSRTSEFLYTDLLRYVTTADEADGRLLRDLPEETVAQIRTALIEAGLGDARLALTPLAQQLSVAHLWPLPMVKVAAVEFDGKEWKMELRQVAR